MMARPSGADVLAQSLIELGCECVFGLPGTQNASTYLALSRAGIRTVLCVNELNAAFMANGYARASGRVGVVAAIPGPGFAFSLGGIAEARLDSAPVLLIAGQPAASPGNRFLHQFIAQEDIARPLVKTIVSVDDADDVSRGVSAAWAATLEGEPGPVLLHLHADAQNGEVSDDLLTDRRTLLPAGSPDVDRTELMTASAKLAGALRPVVFVGQGAAEAADAVRMLVQRLGAPTFSTPSGRGVLSEEHPLCLGFDPNRGGVGALKELIKEADVVLALGCRMGFNGTAGFQIDFSPSQLIHVNTDREALDGMRPASVPVLGSVESAVPLLLEQLVDAAPRWSPEEVERWRTRIEGQGSDSPPEPTIHGVTGGRSKKLIEAIRTSLGPHGILLTDSGLHQVLVRRHYEVTIPRGLIVPADFQSMGFGVPAAIGAKLAMKDRKVVAVVGDGGFTMSAMELLTAAREHIPLVVVVLNDGYLNLIRLQQLDDGATAAVTLQNPDFQALAGACGVGYALVDGNPLQTMTWALDQDGPVVVEVLVGDSPAIAKLKASGAARNVARKVLGPSRAARLKRVLLALRGR